MMLKIKMLFALLCFTLTFFELNEIVAQSSADENKSVAVVAIVPAYPPQAVAERAEGDVFVDVKIDAAGKVVEALFFDGHESLKNSVTKAALKWKFNPVGTDEKFRQTRITFTFYLNDDNFEQPNIDEIKFKHKMKIYRSFFDADCFNECGNPK